MLGYCIPNCVSPLLVSVGRQSKPESQGVRVLHRAVASPPSVHELAQSVMFSSHPPTASGTLISTFPTFNLNFHGPYLCTSLSTNIQITSTMCAILTLLTITTTWLAGLPTVVLNVKSLTYYSLSFLKAQLKQGR